MQLQLEYSVLDIREGAGLDFPESQKAVAEIEASGQRDIDSNELLLRPFCVTTTTLPLRSSVSRDR